MQPTDLYVFFSSDITDIQVLSPLHETRNEINVVA